jgi:hypothetical protein
MTFPAPNYHVAGRWIAAPPQHDHLGKDAHREHE